MTVITREELEATDGSSIIGHIADDANAEARTAQTKLRDFINVMDFHDPLDTDDLTDALDTAINDAFPGLDAVQIFIPEGEYVVTRQIIATRRVTIRGAGMLATILNFTDVAEIDSEKVGAISLAGAADFSFLEDLTIRISGDRPEGFDYGLWSCVRVFARNLTFDQCGAKLEAGTLIAGSGSVDGNVCLSELSNCHALYPTEHGFMIDGTIANACKIIGCNSFVAAGYGFYEASFLGNSYLGCHADGGGVGTSGYKVPYGPGCNRSIVLGCYAEPNFTGDAWDVATPAMIVSPLGVMPGSSGTTNAVLAGSGASGFAIGDQLNFVGNLNGYSFGDSTNPATKVFTGGMLIRGQGDGHLYFMVGQGTAGLGMGGAGVSLVKWLMTSPYTKHELIHFGDTRNRVAFPCGLIATLPTYANNSAATGGGLTAGEVYKTSTGEVRIVI
jgi:hypothetical protein